MEYRRIIPCLDVADGRVVKGVNFVDLKDAGDPVEMAATYDAAGADEIAFLDITATTQGRPSMIDVAARTREVVSVPFTVGGGMRTLDGVRAMIEAGADRVSLNTAVVKNPALISQIRDAFDSTYLVVAIDVRRFPGKVGDAWEVMTAGGRDATGIDAIAWAREAARLGAGSILPTSMDSDGVQDGYDIPLIRAMTRASGLPVIASGGAGKPEHFVEAIVDGHADAVLAASVFHFGTLSIKEVKDALRSAGIAVREA